MILTIFSISSCVKTILNFIYCIYGFGLFGNWEDFEGCFSLAHDDIDDSIKFPGELFDSCWDHQYPGSFLESEMSGFIDIGAQMIFGGKKGLLLFWDYCCFINNNFILVLTLLFLYFFNSLLTLPRLSNTLIHPLHLRSKR